MENLKKKLMKTVSVCLAAVLAVGCLAGCEKKAGKGGLGSDNSKAKAVVKDVMKAMTDGDAEALVDLIPDDFINEIGKAGDMSESEVEDYLEEELSESLSEFKEEYGDVEYKIGDVRDADDDELEDTKDAYDEMNIEVEDLKYVEVEAEDETEEFSAIKVDGRWYIDLYGLSQL